MTIRDIPPRTFGLASAILAAFLSGIIGASLRPDPVRAQFSGQQTWVTSVGGGANTVTLAIPNINQLSDLLGVSVRFLPTNVNAAGATTINPSTIGAVTVRRSSGGTMVPIAGGDFTTGTMVEVVYDGTQFNQTNPATGTAQVGSEMYVTAGTAAPAGYLIENGTCISQTTYVSLWNYYGNSDVWSPGATGGACPAGQFHLPFANGRTASAFDTQGGVTANVVTSAGSNCAAVSAGLICGSQNVTLGTTQLPNTAPNFTGTSQSWSSIANLFGAAGEVQLGAGAFSGAPSGVFGTSATTAQATTAVTPSGSVSSINGNVTQVGTATLSPTYTVLKVVKY